MGETSPGASRNQTPRSEASSSEHSLLIAAEDVLGRTAQIVNFNLISQPSRSN
jgi:hypothetical protein